MDPRYLPPHLLARAAELPENAHASALDPWREEHKPPAPLADPEVSRALSEATSAHNRSQTHAKALDLWRSEESTLSPAEAEMLERARIATRDAQNRSRKLAKSAGAISPRRKGATKRRGVPTRLEEQFKREIIDTRCWGDLSGWRCEGVTLRIADVGAITPDWVAWDSLNRLYLFEVKGHKVHESAVLRTKAFAAAYPQVRFLIYCRRDKRWHLYFDSKRGEG